MSLGPRATVQMEPIRRSGMGSNTSMPVPSAVSIPSAVVGFLFSPARASLATVASHTKTTGLCHGDSHRVPSQHCTNSSNVIQHHQYPSILVSGPPPLIRSSLIHPTGSLLPTSPQSLLSTTTAETSNVIPQYQQHSGGSHQLVTAPTPSVSASPIVMSNSNISTVGMAISPFGILPHERVVPHNTNNRHQHKKLPQCPQSTKILMETSSTNSGQILSSPVAHSQRFYAESPTLSGNKIKHYDNIQLQHQRVKLLNGPSDKNLPVVSSGYAPQPYEQRYQPRTALQQVGYLSVITRTAVTTANGAVLDDIAANNNYYQAQAVPLQSKIADNHDRQYYNFDSSVSASQTPQHQVDNMLLMGSPVQRGDPMHIVKNLQSMQTDVDCYGVKKIIEQQPRLLVADSSKSVGPTTLLSNSNKCIIEHQPQHLQQLPKSAVIDPSSSYNSQYFNRRQPPPAHLHQHQNQSHLQQHLVTGNTKMLSTPTSLTVVSANGNTYLDVQQHQRHQRWNLDQQKPSTVSTPSCFSANISTGIFHQPSQQHHQYSNAISQFNVQLPVSSVHQPQQLTQPTHHNNYIVSSGTPTYYNPTTMVLPTITSVTTTTSSMSYNRHNHNNQQNINNFHDFTNNLQGGHFTVNEDNKPQICQQVIVPNIEQELSHLCNDLTFTPIKPLIQPANVTKKPSFIDSYIKFLNGGANNSTVETEDEGYEKSKKMRPLSSSTPKPMSKPYIPLSKPKAVPSSEQTSSKSGSIEDIKKTSNIITTTDDDPRYFPLPKTSSSIAGISDDRSDGSNGDNNWLSADDDQDPWWKSSSKTTNTSTASVIKNKVDVVNKKNKKNNTAKKKQTNNVTAIKKQKTQHEQQPRRQLSHRLAKEKTQKLLSSSIHRFDVDDDEILSDANSDVDPAWIPNDDNDVTKNTNIISNRRNFSHKKFSKEQCSNNVRSQSTSSSINNNNNDQIDDDSTVAIPFKSGSFVALKSQFLDNGQMPPPQLWRVDGKSLLQKFQRCNGDNVYKSVSTYTGWGPSHYNMYRQVAIQFVTSYNGLKIIPNKTSNINVIVKLLNDNVNNSDQNNSVDTEVRSTDCKLTSKSKTNDFNSNASTSVDDQNMLLRGNFDVYIQTLASHALDSNFLGEIYRENDDYFLSNVRAIETVTQTCIQALDSVIAQDSLNDKSNVENIHTLLTKYPNLEMCSTNDILSISTVQLRCIVCGYQGFVEKQNKFIEISLSGVEYNPQTLEDVDDVKPFSKIMPMKRIHCCSSAQCSDKLIILHSLEHLKYHIYKECCKHISTENNDCKELTQDTTTVLNRLLADDEWIEKLFQMVCNTWSRAQKFISNKQSNCRVPS